ncbi:hypothetical protein MRB53_005617 [Persea americana]|uniref:Uncharacterized protein n=1 Tax=Persea americana TaxID=3435 RepID=A0ACC2MDU1_PERAE|nr:hypothetical protein MRB53_005617 [Persea americana]
MKTHISPVRLSPIGSLRSLIFKRRYKGTFLMQRNDLSTVSSLDHSIHSIDHPPHHHLPRHSIVFLAILLSPSSPRARHHLPPRSVLAIIFLDAGRLVIPLSFYF